MKKASFSNIGVPLEPHTHAAGIPPGYPWSRFIARSATPAPVQFLSTPRHTSQKAPRTNVLFTIRGTPPSGLAWVKLICLSKATHTHTHMSCGVSMYRSTFLIDRTTLFPARKRPERNRGHTDPVCVKLFRQKLYLVMGGLWVGGKAGSYFSCLSLESSPRAARDSFAPAACATCTTMPQPRHRPNPHSQAQESR